MFSQTRKLNEDIRQTVFGNNYLFISQNVDPNTSLQ